MQWFPSIELMFPTKPFNKIENITLIINLMIFDRLDLI